MKVSQVMLSKGFGGAERYFVDLCTALARRGHAVQTICHRGSEAERRLRGIPNLELAPIRVLGTWDPLASWAIHRALRRFAPQIVHVHLARAAKLAGRAAHALGKPVVTKLHNYVNLKYYGNIDWFNVTTDSQRRYLREKRVPEERIRVIPNFSTLLCARKVPEPAAEPIDLASYGRFVHKKGFDLLLQAFAQLRPSFPQLRLRLGGAGEEEAALKAQVAELGLSEAVTFVGWVEDVPQFLAPADLFILPSRDEPFGIVVLEAMACGVPIVSTRTQGPLEILDEETAWMCAVDDAEDLARTIARALRDPQQRHERARWALKRYRERYHEDAVIPQLLALYEEAIAARQEAR